MNCKNKANEAGLSDSDFLGISGFVLLIFALFLCFVLLYFLYFEIIGIKNCIFHEIL